MALQPSRHLSAHILLRHARRLHPLVEDGESHVDAELDPLAVVEEILGVGGQPLHLLRRVEVLSDVWVRGVLVLLDGIRAVVCLGDVDGYARHWGADPGAASHEAFHLGGGCFGCL